MGRGYVIEHCVSTLKLIIQQEIRDIYITDVLKGIAKAVGIETNMRYADVVQQLKQPQIEEERTPEEIINAIKAKAELLNDGFNESGRKDNP